MNVKKQNLSQLIVWIVEQEGSFRVENSLVDGFKATSRDTRACGATINGAARKLATAILKKRK